MRPYPSFIWNVSRQRGIGNATQVCTRVQILATHRVKYRFTAHDANCCSQSQSLK
jgi:hypothetical protein